MAKKIVVSKKVVISIISAIVIGIGLIKLFSMVLVSSPNGTETKSYVINSINNAESIVIRKKFSIKRKFVVFVNDKPIATVEGKVLPVLGETFSLIAGNGDVIATAKQNIFSVFNKTADISFNNRSITFKKSIFPFVGGSISTNDNQDDFCWGFFSNSIKENNSVSYHIIKNPVISSITIEKKDSSKYDIPEVILMACFNNMSEESSSSSNSSSSKNK